MLDGFRRIGRFSLRWWPVIALSTLVSILCLSWWSAGAIPIQDRLRWPVTELMAAWLLVHIGLLWAPLLADPRDLAASVWRRLGRLPDPYVGFIAATLALLGSLAALLVADSAARFFSGAGRAGSMERAAPGGSGR